MCGHLVDWFPVINRHAALKPQPQTAKVLMLKDHGSNYQKLACIHSVISISLTQTISDLMLVVGCCRDIASMS